MPFLQHLPHRALPLLCAAALIGCAGKQHQAPAEDAPDAATAVFKGSSTMGPALYALQFNAKGCVQGRTEVPRAGSSRPMRLVPGEEKFFGLDTASMNNSSCRIAVSFVPEANVQYQLVDFRSSGGFGKPDFCAVDVKRIDPSGATSPVPSRGWRIVQASMACHRAVP
ncbi:hypothetical protein [Piscinibacter gummiphilus]|uniref:Uncharacterized protein n=1 Tax=Piscinibacter gummiphilus TaxID=946333 RepID=A0A1W6LCK1_9BURK|nr:hypothetical protein [Piscinibacter gummiphilus]ARN21976.1 hypothetical protein A4W93_19900 [Piscinibacter gummiphilus]ATU66661.1 hypothetical protein CPZ87_19995 [Piscinibacter gummiphilus]GLS94047.1 hypothetical protein GCM10007918_13390 [Piscinibacter gummiphilus]